MSNKQWIGPHLGQRVVIGPDIVVEGWGRRYSSPYQLPVTLPTEWNGPDKPDFTRGRHLFRTVPRGSGGSPSQSSHNLGCSACSLGADETKQGSKTLSIIAGALGLVFLVYMWRK